MGTAADRAGGRLASYGTMTFTPDDLERHPECRHMPLVQYIARQLWLRWDKKLPGLDLDDLVILGWMALRKAWQNHDPSRGEFGRYAARVIRRRLWYAIRAQRHVVYVPPVVLGEAMRVSRGQPVSAAFRQSYPDAQAALDAALTVLNQKATGVAALDLAAAPGDRDSLATYELLAAALAELRPEERQLLCERYGVGMEPRMTTDIAQERGISRQAVHVYEQRAIQRARKALPQHVEPAPAPRQRNTTCLRRGVAPGRRTSRGASAGSGR